MRFFLILILFVLPNFTQAQNIKIGVVDLDSVIQISREHVYLDSVRQTLFHQENIMIASIGEKMLSYFEQEAEKYSDASQKSMSELETRMRNMEQNIIKIADGIDAENQERKTLIGSFVTTRVEELVEEIGETNKLNLIVDSNSVYFKDLKKNQWNDITPLLMEELQYVRGEIFSMEQQMRIQSRKIQEAIQLLEQEQHGDTE